MKIRPMKVLLALMLLMQACSNEPTTIGEEKNMHNYKIYSEDETLSNLSVETGKFENGYRKLLQLGIYQRSEGTKVWRARLERELHFKELSIDDLVIEHSEYEDIIQVTEKKDIGKKFIFRSYFYQGADEPLDFDRYAGLCSPLADFSEDQDCSMDIKTQNMRVRVSFDKSQLERVKEFKQMAEEIVADYLPKYSEKFN